MNDRLHSTLTGDANDAPLSDSEPSEASRPRYRKPQLHRFGSLEKVQQFYDGWQYDGPYSSYWRD